MLNRIFKFSALALVALVIVISSCEKEPFVEPLDQTISEDITDILELNDDGSISILAFSEIVTEDSTEATEEENRRRRKVRPRLNRCYNLLFPITVEYPDGTQVEAESYRAFRALIKEWREANPEATERPTIVFPYEVELPDGEILVIEDLMDFASIINRCNDRFRFPFRKVRCYDLVYPLTIVFPDSTELEVDSSKAMRMAIHEWLKENGRGADRISIKFPYSISLNDETVITINNAEELRAVVQRCREYRADKKCFSVVFPATVKFPNGREITVNSRREYLAAINLWIDRNPRSRVRPKLAFPYTVEFEDGTQVELKNAQDFRRAAQQCRDEE